MYADSVTESMQVAIDETDRRRAVQATYNTEHGIEPTTIVKGIHDLNQRLRAVAESTVVYSSEREALGAAGRSFDEADRAKVEALLGRMEAEMRAAAKQLEFERAAALRDEIQQVRLRVLEQDASVTVARAAERAAREAGAAVGGLTGAADRARGRRAAGRPSPTGCRASATSMRTAAAGRLVGWTGRPGTGRSPRTSAGAPASDHRGGAAKAGRRVGYDPALPITERQNPTAVASPASVPPRSKANGISELVSMARRPPAARAAKRSPVMSGATDVAR
jgi:hypothetical protein